ncbi:MAG: hypothetical protein U9Q15_01495 [Patescibacteria group bacterium]|nr:hypothetical protein [Patescibacteria group bacterium]
MRTQRDDVNLSNIAKIFGGGGHIKAAGFFIPGKLHRRNYWEIKE